MAYTTIDDPSAYFQTALYTGTGSGFSVTNSGNSDLQPDWVWVKDRDASNDHKITDSSRLASGKPSITLESNTTAVEFDDADPMSTDSFDTDGFTIGTNGNYNTDGNTYVAWQWKCNGGTTETAVDESGSNPANVRQTNTDAGFSIITYTGTGSAGTIAHGLGAVPHVIIIKCRNIAHDWCVYHHKNTAAPETDFLVLNESNATADNDNKWNDTAPTSTNITLKDGGGVNANDQTHVAYVFTEKQGYSKFGSYTGNGSTDGAFVYTGFSPAWVMVKRTDSGNNWHMHDNKRVTSNPNNITQYANLANADASEDLDMLSNGFRLKESGGGYNANNGTYVYMAFAESPFVSSEGVPTTAR